MTRHAFRSSARLWVVLALALAGATSACTGAITDASGTGSSVPPDRSMLPPGRTPEGQVCTTTRFTPTRLWRLSDEQFVTAITDLTGLRPDDISTPGRSRAEFVNFAETLPVTSALASDIRASVEKVAALAVQDLPKLMTCPAGQSPEACAGGFINRFGARAFRRPLEAAEKTELQALYDNGAADGGAKEGIRLVVAAVLQAPSFLYRVELGTSGAAPPEGKLVELTPVELASALSFFLLDSIPDPELMAAAQASGDGSLSRAAVFTRQVDRLLTLPRVQDNLTRMLGKWVGLGDGVNVDLASKFPAFNAELKASMEEETRLFFKSVLTRDGTLGDLLTSTRGHVNKALATHLGMSTTTSGTAFTEVSYPATQRAGILTLPGVLARYSLGHMVVFRGKYVRDELLCGELQPPPNELSEAIEAENLAAGMLSEHEQADRRLANAACGGCHSQMDPLGLSFMNYDPLGRYQANENGKPVDARGIISGTGDVDGQVTGAVELGQKLAQSKAVRLCMQEKLLSYTIGRMLEDFDRCELSRIDAYVQANGGRLSDVIAAIVKSDTFRFRTGGR